MSEVDDANVLIVNEVPKKPWYRQKTTWTGVSAIVGAAAAFATGGIDLGPAIQLAITGLIGIFLRQGVENAK